MTEPLSHLDLLKQYHAEVEELDSLPPAETELTARQALAIVTHLQIAAVNPAVRDNPLLPDAIAAAKQIQSSFNPESAAKVFAAVWRQRQKEQNNRNL